MDGANALLTAVGSAITTITGWVGGVVTDLLSGELAPLLPLFAIGIGVSAILLAIRVIRGFIWGA